MEDTRPLWIERLGEYELVDIHWKYVQRCIAENWKDEENNLICELLRSELQIRMCAE